MTPADKQPQRIAVIGGGIAGLAAAYRLTEKAPQAEVLLLESADRVGGALHTEVRDGWLIEQGADNFITNVPWAVELCRRIGFEENLLQTSRDHRGALVVHQGRLHKIPAGFQLMAPTRLVEMLRSPLLSPLGKLRLAAERFVPRRKDGADESLAEFATRRLGPEVFERLVQPLAGGIYTADAEQLSVAAALPQFVRMEQDYGSLIRGARKLRGDQDATDDTSGGARYGLFVAPRDGMTSWVNALASQLSSETIRLGARVDTLQRNGQDRWTIRLQHDQVAEVVDAVIVATRSSVAAGIVSDVDLDLSRELSAVPYAGTAVVILGFRRDQVSHPLDAFGLVVPAVEQRQILAASFASVKFSGRAPQGSVLIRVFIGGACQAELLDRDDGELVQLARDELRQLIGAVGEPVLREVRRWPAAMPQYHVGHLQRVERIRARLETLPGLQLAGAAYAGVGIPQCIHSGQHAADRLLNVDR